MKLWPRSLLWRTFLLVALLMLLSILAWFAIFRFYQEEPRAHQAAQLMISVVNLTRSAITNAAPGKRRELLRDLSDREGIHIYPYENNESITPLDNEFILRRVKAQLLNELGPQTEFTLERNGEQAVFISFSLDENGDNEYWVALPRERIEHVLHRQWLGWGLAAILLSLGGAYLIVFRITQPLRELSLAARQLGQGHQPATLTEKGPVEIIDVTRAFNQMSADLSRLDSDRALILAGISHDLRTPLTRLRMAIEMVNDASDDNALMQSTSDGMIADIEEMDQTINQFLDFARETGNEAVQETDLTALLNDLSNQYARRGINLDSQLALLPPCQLRPLSIRRAVSNLLDNALHYAGPAGLSLRLCRDATAKNILIEVGDRGPGIAPTEIERLKLPFTRLESARSNSSGAGLGLAIVERIARNHQGLLELLPRPQGGLLARIILPGSLLLGGSDS
ncbi:MAG: HAMP domain-containing protein [Sterolibacterium sp.]|nr:HAMP domain-containing protein [Sterolibacterium sp.]